VVQIWPGQTVTCLLTNSPGHIWATLYKTDVDPVVNLCPAYCTQKHILMLDGDFAGYLLILWTRQRNSHNAWHYQFIKNYCVRISLYKLADYTRELVDSQWELQSRARTFFFFFTKQKIFGKKCLLLFRLMSWLSGMCILFCDSWRKILSGYSPKKVRISGSEKFYTNWLSMNV
jgi:hypothetical protein